ncbi:MAG: sigma-70 family RNA polymerase sigma factor [Bifidobacteriaceae bacterium]|jgi:RNA polymerase sigma-70 factor (ECF subfamily)|nr:sigma-70 family RNA polymerase sigma factor [Bifidobacteriaceae bacterium]
MDNTDRDRPEEAPVTVTAPPAEVCAPTTRVAVARHSDMVYAIALTHTACVADAEDAFQEVFLAFHRKRPELRDAEHLKAWLIATAVNCARRVAASAWRRRTDPLEEGAAEPADQAQFTFQTERQDAVFRALRALPETYRTVLHLFYFEDLPSARIAELLGIGNGAVKMRLSRGRELLRRELEGVELT